LILPPGHPLAGRRAVTCEDLAGQLLLLPKAGTTRSRVNAWLEPVEDRVQISMELDSTEMIKRFVLAGMGVSFLASSHFQEGIDAGQFAAASLAPEPLMRRLGLVYRRDKAFSKAGLGFIQVVMERARHVAAASPVSSVVGVEK